MLERFDNGILHCVCVQMPFDFICKVSFRFILWGLDVSNPSGKGLRVSEVDLFVIIIKPCPLSSEDMENK